MNMGKFCILIFTRDISKYKYIKSFINGSDIQISQRNGFESDILINQYKLIIVFHEIDIDLELMEEIKQNCLYNRCIIILDESDKDLTSQYLHLHFTYITTIDFAKYLTSSIISLFRHGQYLRNTYYKGLYIYPSESYIFLKGNKIFLSKMEIAILVFLTQTGKYKRLECILEYLNSLEAKSFSRCYVTVYISRINRKVFNITGLRIVENKRGVGYYLNL